MAVESRENVPDTDVPEPGTVFEVVVDPGAVVPLDG